MKKIYLTLVSLFFASFTMFGQNMVVNGDMEQWDDATTPTGWAKAENISQETTNVHGGTYSAAHESASSTKDLQQDLDGIVGGLQYTISYYYLDNDPSARTRIWSYWMDAEDNYLDENEEELRPGTYSEDNAEWQHYEYTLTAPLNAAKFRYEVRVYKQDGNTGGHVYYDDFSFEPVGGSDPEPSNYPTDFAAAASGTHIDLSWTDATGEQLPLAYLILGSNNGGSFTPPTDGTPVSDDLDWSDGMIAVNVMYGVEAYTLAVDPATDYDFIIYPYTNAADNIDYKTDGDPPTASATSNNYVIVNNETFDSDLGSWTGYSVNGDQVWEWADYGNPPGCAKMTGHDGENYPNEDWLISPVLDLHNYTEIYFSFDHARNYSTNDGLSVLVSTDYDGTSDPSTSGTWSDVTDMFTFPEEGTWSFSSAGEGDMSAYNGASTYFAFRYISTADDCSTWEVDNPLVYGIIGVGVQELNEVSVTLYPNPATDVVNISCLERGQLIIMSVSGQVMMQQTVEKGMITVDMNNRAPGVYLVRFTTETGNTTTRKLILR
jgi:hypothetical protein